MTRLISANAVVSYACAALLGGMLNGCSGSGNDLPLMSDQPKNTVGNDGPEGDSGLSLGDIRYPLDAALGNIWGVMNDHFRIDFTLTDGNFSVGTVTVEGQDFLVLVPGQGTAVVHAAMFSPGASFDYSSYAFVSPENLPVSSPGVGYFTDAYVGVDENLDSTVTEDERHSVIDGVIDFKGTLPSDIALDFSMSLSNGQSVTGNYTGLFDFTLR